MSDYLESSMVISSVPIDHYSSTQLYESYSNSKCHSSSNSLNEVDIPNKCSSVSQQKLQNNQILSNSTNTEVHNISNYITNEMYDKTQKTTQNEAKLFERRNCYSKINSDIEELIKEDTPFSKKLQETQKIVDEAYERYGNFGFSFNGGKDCTVLLHILAAGLYRYSVRHPEIIPKEHDLPPIPTIYIMQPNPFPEIDTYIDESTIRYGLDLLSIAGSMKTALQTFLNVRHNIQAISVGVRKSDPHSDHLNPFSYTDKGWPSFMRVHPIINWDYHEVWTFLLRLKIPYCNLYEKGYTSLGGTDNTLPNPALKIENNENKNEVSYLPAYKLKDGSLERNGRIKKTPSPHPLR